MKVTIINGPNLNLVGRREPEIYGSEIFEKLITAINNQYPQHSIAYFQSNVEGELINIIQSESATADGIILNAGAYTHTSIAIADAVAAANCPIVEVHMSNIFAREDFRHVSFLGAKCIGSISGFGLNSYLLAMHYLVNYRP